MNTLENLKMACGSVISAKDKDFLRNQFLVIYALQAEYEKSDIENDDLVEHIDVLSDCLRYLDGKRFEDIKGAKEVKEYMKHFLIKSQRSFLISKKSMIEEDLGVSI